MKRSIKAPLAESSKAAELYDLTPAIVELVEPEAILTSDFRELSSQLHIGQWYHRQS